MVHYIHTCLLHQSAYVTDSHAGMWPHLFFRIIVKQLDTVQWQDNTASLLWEASSDSMAGLHKHYLNCQTTSHFTLANSIRVHGAQQPSASRMYPWAPWELSEVSEDWAGKYMNKISNKTRQLWPACKLQNQNQVGYPCSKLSNEHQIMMQLGCICFSSSPYATKRHTSDGLHLANTAPC